MFNNSIDWEDLRDSKRCRLYFTCLGLDKAWLKGGIPENPQESKISEKFSNTVSDPAPIAGSVTGFSGHF